MQNTFETGHKSSRSLKAIIIDTKDSQQALNYYWYFIEKQILDFKEYSWYPGQCIA